MSRQVQCYQDRSQSGFSLVEVLLAAVLIVLFLVPAMQAMTTVTRIGTESNELIRKDRILRDKLDEVLSLSFEQLSGAAGNPGSESAFSDPNGMADRIAVFVSHFDGDASGLSVDSFIDGNQDDELVWIRVTYPDSGHELATLVRR